jgi:hypothetical protein
MKTIKLILIALILNSCSGSQEVVPVCRHYSIFTAITWESLTGDRVLIGLGPSGDSDIWHSQSAVVDSDGNVKNWLTFKNGVVTIGKKDDFQPVEMIEPGKYFDMLSGRKYVVSQ